MGAPDGGGGNCEIVTPFVAPRFTVRSGWMTVFKWMSSLNARGEFAAKVTGKGAVVEECQRQVSGGRRELAHGVVCTQAHCRSRRPSH